MGLLMMGLLFYTVHSIFLS